MEGALKYVCWNGEIVEASKIQFFCLSEGMLYGYGAFETMKFADAKVCFFTEHWARLLATCDFLGLSLAFRQDVVLNKINELIHLSGMNSGGVRLALFKNDNTSDLLVNLMPQKYKVADYEKGFSLMVSNTRKYSGDPYLRHKTNNYLHNIQTLTEAKKHGFNDALFLNENAIITESCIANVFFVSEYKQELYTPSVDCGLLPGVVRSKVLEVAKSLGIQSIEGAYRLDILETATECFMTNSLLEIMPVYKIDDKQFDISKATVTRSLKAKFLGSFFSRI